MLIIVHFLTVTVKHIQLISIVEGTVSFYEGISDNNRKRHIVPISVCSTLYFSEAVYLEMKRKITFHPALTLWKDN